MRIGRPLSKSSRRLTALFLAVLVPPAVILVWLGLRLLEQDRKDGLARDFERREAAAGGIIRALDQSLADAEHWLTGDEIPDGALGLTLSASGAVDRPAGRALWLPALAPIPEAATQPFAEAEAAEFKEAGDRGLARYEELARSAEPGVKAGALLRVARVHRRQGRTDAALRGYQRLAGIAHIAIEGTPSDLIARRAICDVLEQAGRTEALGREAAALRTDFLANRWRLDRATWELAATQIARWTAQPLAPPADRKALTAAAEWLWEAWRRTDGARLPASGRRAIVVGDTAVTLIWRTDGPRLDAVALSATVVGTWTQKAGHSDPSTTARLSLLLESGELLAGEMPDSGAGVVKRLAADTKLPWTVALSAAGDRSQETSELASRRHLLSLGLAAIVLFLSGGGYLLWRVVSRELAVARLQTDFVAAVSHEFRTPLTSLRHVTELLDEDDDLPLPRRKSFYSVLGRSTDRLSRLVESLLDFAGMENDRKPWDMRSTDVGELATAVAADFRSQTTADRVTIEVDVADAGALRVRADAEALSHALWNLLDNAVKYSPDAGAVRLSVHHHPGGVAISVRDHGLGIPRHERKDIFRKFVRGMKARELGIKGTGLGLAMVSHIVKAHGGAIELETEEGRGSTFRLVLPARA
jgi:signal transduction histidine kinase